MTEEEALQFQRNYSNATKSGAYLEWDLAALTGVQKQLREARIVLRPNDWQAAQECEVAIEKLNRAIELRQIEEREEQHHQQAMKVGRKTLCVAWWTLGAAIVVPIAVALIAEIPFSMLLPAKASQSPTPLPQQSPTIYETPVTTIQPSASPTESATPEAASSPE